MPSICTPAASPEGSLSRASQTFPGRRCSRKCRTWRPRATTCDDECSGNLADILPTINYVSGLGIPPDIDGKIIEEVFGEDFLNNVKPRAGQSDEQPVKGSGSMSDDESGKMIDLLEGLGYLN